MSTIYIYLPVTTEQVAALSGPAARFLLQVLVSGGSQPEPDTCGADRTLRSWRREIEDAGIGCISWDRKAGGWVVQWTTGGDSVASAWVARHRATEAALEYPALGVDEYRFLRSQAPGLDDADFDSRLTAAVLSARLAGIRPGSLLEWLSRGLAASSPVGAATSGGGDDQAGERAEWRVEFDEFKRRLK